MKNIELIMGGLIYMDQIIFDDILDIVTRNSKLIGKNDRGLEMTFLSNNF